MKRHFGKKSFWLFLATIAALVVLFAVRTVQGQGLHVTDAMIGGLFILIGGFSAWKGTKLISWNGFCSVALMIVGIYIELYYFIPAVRK